MPSVACSVTNSRGRRRSGLLWLGMVAAALVSVAVIFLILQAPGFQHLVVRSWLEDLDRRCGIHLEMESFCWNRLFLLTIDGVQMHLEGRLLLQCDRVIFAFSPLLRSPFWRVRELVLDHPVFYLEKDAGGRWKSVLPASKDPDAMPHAAKGGSKVESELTVTVRVQSGSVVAEQAGHRVLSVGTISGRLTVPYDGGIGVGSLLTNLERLRPATPQALTLHGGGRNADHREESAP